MKQNKDKHIREMWIVIVVLMITLLLGLGVIFVENHRAYKAEQELQFCQDKVPEINKMKRICCHYFDKIEVCLNTEAYSDKEIPEHCEVIE